MRFLLTLLCLWWIESSVAFAAGLTESLTLGSMDNKTAESSASTITAEELTTKNGKRQDSTTTKQWDTSSTTDGPSPPASFASTFFSSFREKDTKSSSSIKDNSEANSDANTYQSLIDWNAHNLLSFLEKLVASRGPNNKDAAPTTLQPAIVEQTKDLVSRIASFYDPNNPYHNFEHATHVTQSLTQLLLRPVALPPDGFLNPLQTIQSDPLLTLALVFAALIHDVGHSGVPNDQLVRENSPLVRRYPPNATTSIAERHSIDLALERLLFQDEAFRDLRRAILGDSDGDRFRHWVTRAVLATDIADPTLRADRQHQWEAVYGGLVVLDGDVTAKAAGTDEYGTDVRTTIALEHLMQVVDVAHTMQGGDINHLWNERLFAELKLAFRQGRAQKDPLEGWYSNELGFFDFYVIPLALKWNVCCGMGEVEEDAEEELHLFGTTSLADQARRNRQEWEQIGHGVVEEFVKKY